MDAVTVFMCGKSECDHDYSKSEPIMEDGKVCGETAVCSKCGARAIEEDMWND